MQNKCQKSTQRIKRCYNQETYLENFTLKLFDYYLKNISEYNYN